MKTTIDININGQIFHIDEEAYVILKDYIDELERTFTKEDEKETISDIEARIAELFTERLGKTKNVIDKRDVDSVLAQLGRPSQFTDEPKNAEPMNDGPRRNRRLYRNPDDKILAGVCSGLAARWGWDPVWVRLLFVLIACCTEGIALPIYIVLWIVMPEAKSVAQKIEMNGGNATAESIHRTRNQVYEERSRAREVLRGILKFCIWAVIALVLLITIPVGLALIVVVFGAIIGAVTLGFAVASWTALTFFGVILIPVICAVTAIIQLLKHKPQPRWPFWVICGILWLASLIGFVGIVTTHDELRDVRHAISQRITDTKGEDEGQYAVVPVDEITKIDVVGVVAMEITQGDEQTILAQDDVKVTSKNGTLYVEGRRNADKTGKNHVKITVRDLRELEQQGVASVVIKDTFKVDYIKLDIEGVASLKADNLIAGTADIKVEGTSAVEIKGQAQRANYDIEGIVSVDCKEFEAQNLHVNCEGACSVRVNASQTANINVEGLGNVELYGDVPTYTGDAQGFSRIKRKH